MHDWLLGWLMLAEQASAVPQAAAFALATLVQEDVPTLAAAAWVAAGRLSWTTGFLGCFLGIWGGDALLYGVARWGGRSILNRAWLRRRLNPSAVATSEAWFARRGVWLLVTSRFVPGTRLPTYLAAGFLRQPLGRFLAVTGITVAVWTSLLFGLGQIAAARMQGFYAGGWEGAVVGVTLVLAGMYGGQRLLRWGIEGGWRRVGAAVERWRRWEFWPAGLFYLPVVGQYLRLAWRHRSLTLPTAANPGIEFGGMVGESKFALLRELQKAAPEFTAESRCLPAATSTARELLLEAWMVQGQVQLPFILKPDVGQRGLGVKLVRSLDQARAYLRQTDAALVAQRYVEGPFEAGVFYYRFPGEERGRILGITEKVFPFLVGDGRHTVEELVWRDKRARLLADRYLARFTERRDEVLPLGEVLRLVQAGNHAQGCIFRDGSRWNTPALADRFDAISRALPGFFIGRYDVRFADEAEFLAGRGFQILELNGAAAEATQVYDARNSLAAAYRTLFHQWELVFAIGAANRARGVLVDSPARLWRVWRGAARAFASYPLAD